MSNELSQTTGGPAVVDGRSAGAGRTPAAVVVGRMLRDQIRGGEYALGAQLPSEPQLAAKLGSSRVTVREALAALEAEGLITRRHGVGTFVSERLPLINSLHHNHSADQMIRSMGMAAGTRESRWRELLATPEVAGRLNVEPETPVVELERIRTADGEPVVFSFDYLPGDILPEHPALLGPSLYAFLRKTCGREVVLGEARLCPYAADAEVARRLEVDPGTLCLLIEQVDYDGDNRPIVYSIEYHLAKAFTFSILRQRPLKSDRGAEEQA